MHCRTFCEEHFIIPGHVSAIQLRIGVVSHAGHLAILCILCLVSLAPGLVLRNPCKEEDSTLCGDLSKGFIPADTYPAAVIRNKTIEMFSESPPTPSPGIVSMQSIDPKRLKREAQDSEEAVLCQWSTFVQPTPLC